MRSYYQVEREEVAAGVLEQGEALQNPGHQPSPQDRREGRPDWLVAGPSCFYANIDAQTALI